MIGWSRSIGLRKSMVGIIVGLSFIGDLCHIAIVVVSMVGDMLGPSIRQGHTVRTLNIAISIPSFSSTVVISCVFIMDSIFIAVGMGIFVRWVVGRSWCMVGRSRLVVGWGRCMVGRSRFVVG